MRFTDHHSLARGKSDEWYTPPYIFEALGLWFSLDPCSPLDGPMPWVPASAFFTAADNGLSQEWNGSVWMNPPFGPETARWLAKLADHGNGVALTFARTDTKWFHESAVRADAICFMAGRPKFYTFEGRPAPYNCGAPIMLLGYGDECAEAVRNCGLGAIATIEQKSSSFTTPLALWPDEILHRKGHEYERSSLMKEDI